MTNLISTKNLIYLTLFFTPVYLIRFSIFIIPLNLLDILILLTIFIWIYENKLSLREKIKSSSKKLLPILPPILLMLLGLLISSFLNNNILSELGIIKSWFILPLIFGFIIFNEIKKNQDFKKMTNIIFYSAFFISLISIVYFLFEKITYDGRLAGFYLSPNHLAMIISPGIIIGLGNIFTNRKINLNKALLILPIILTLFLTHSYGAWVAIFLSLIIFLFIKNKKIIIALILILLLFFMLENNSDKFEKITNLRENSSLNSRIAIWKSSAKILSDNWLWGIGPGNFQEKYLDYQKYFPPYPEWAVPQPHNIFLAFWLQAGLAGLIGFLYLISLWFTKTIKILISAKDFYQKNIILILTAIVSSTLIHGLIDTPYWKNDLALIFWSVIFMGASVIQKNVLENNSK